MIPLSLIAAVDAKFGIGKDGQLPWHLPADLKHFKTITTTTNDPAKTNVVIMGRKTWESIPEKFRPLPGRINIILSRDEGFKLPEGVVLQKSYNSAIAYVDQQLRDTAGEVFLIGGEEAFKAAFASPVRPLKKVYLTHIEKDFGCDVFFPSSLDGFRKASETPPSEQNGLTYRFAEYEPQKPL